MRISDWSSDVCSSVLAASGVRRQRGGNVAVADEDMIEPPKACGGSGELPTVEGECGEVGKGRGGSQTTPPVSDPSAGHFRGPAGRREIGRASCRERVCQYV